MKRYLFLVDNRIVTIKAPGLTIWTATKKIKTKYPNSIIILWNNKITYSYDFIDFNDITLEHVL